MIATTATNKKVRELFKSVRDGTLTPRPEFQRRFGWTAKDKDKFIESVVKGYPFPEIYICNGDVNTDTGEGTQLLVDGLQSVSTLNEFFSGDSTFSHVLTMPYRELTQDEKAKFLEYNVVVRDLGQLNKEQIIEVFRRLNSTQYTLRDMKINNAIYDGAIKKFCERVSENEFFDRHRIFLTGDRKRMGDVSFCLSMVATMMLGYFNRDNEHETILKQFNETFPDEHEHDGRIQGIFDFIDECGFDERSRIWKKADFFTAFIELDAAMHVEYASLEPANVLEALNNFYASVDGEPSIILDIAEIYYKPTLQASNDRNSRIRRGIIINGVLNNLDSSDVIANLKEKSLI